jgi:NAD(P)-dependent dehydrogenase (short-subunit alcohol dehydrogenase family)
MGILDDQFGLAGQVAVVTGGSGAIGRVMAAAMAGAGARVAVLGRRIDACDAVVAAINETGGEAIGLSADVLQGDQLEAARGMILNRWGRIDILVNTAGGNLPAATLTGDQTFFDLSPAAFHDVLTLNLTGTLLPCQVFGQAMVQREGEEARGCIVNISSMAAQRALTRVAGYSAAKGAIDAFTRWLAVDLARRYGPGLRVNAIAPGFFIGEQNRAMLLDDAGNLTERGRTIVERTPAGRFGETSELASTLLWLCGPGAGFVNGIVVPVDGGFSAFSGV